MASPFAASVLPVAKPEEEDARLPAAVIDLGAPDDVSFESGAKKIEQPDGSVVIDLNGAPSKPKSDKFSANLAEELDEAELNKIATELLEGIRRDDDSRREHLEMISEGMKLLGLVIESNNAGTSTSSAPLEGMSTVRHPLLLEACQLFQANAMGELLPAAGPVKVRDDRPQQPESMMGHNGGPPLDGPNPFAPPSPGPASPQPGLGAPGAGAPPGAGMQLGVMPPVQPMPQGPAPMPPQGAPSAPPMMPPPIPPMPAEEPRDELANALEKDFNHYLTAVDKGYVADTDQMLFKTGFGGLGVKKVYNCPLKRMPLARSIDIEDFIVSNALSDLADARRITHRIKMAPSTLRRMQIVGAYRDIPLIIPTGQSDQANPVDQAKAEVAGVTVNVTDPRDADYEIYETYCELELDEFAPKQFKGKGLALPYKVTIEKESQKVLEIRRNWNENDSECLRKEYFVDYPYMRAFGFYCIGLLHLLGNTTKALTALWREFIDAGMFANFPGFLYLKGAGRQLTNQFRVAPGSGVGLDSNATNIRDAVMALPYKNPDAGFVQFVTHVEQLGQRLGGTANTEVGEGKQDAPVGTTLALIEQATKPLGAVTKRLHNSQAREFALLKERFRDDPEAFWRFNKKPAMPWQKEQFIKALEDYDLVPVSDPNNPTRMHRAAKAAWLQQVAVQAPGLLDPKKTFLRAASEMEIGDVEDLISPTFGQPQAPPVDPAKMADVQHKQAKAQLDAQVAAGKAQTDVQITQLELQDKEAERQNKLELAQLEVQTERLRLASTIAIHASSLDDAQRAANIKLISDHVGKAVEHENAIEAAQMSHEQTMAHGGVAHERAKETAAEAHERSKEMAEHAAKLAPKKEAKK